MTKTKKDADLMSEEEREKIELEAKMVYDSMHALFKTMKVGNSAIATALANMVGKIYSFTDDHYFNEFVLTINLIRKDIRKQMKEDGILRD